MTTLRWFVFGEDEEYFPFAYSFILRREAEHFHRLIQYHYPNLKVHTHPVPEQPTGVAVAFQSLDKFMMDR